MTSWIGMRPKRAIRSCLAAAALCGAFPVAAAAQQEAPAAETARQEAPPPAAAQRPADAEAAMPVDVEEASVLTEDELDDLVAPIALYPDAQLAQIFVASTYPLDVVKAARWTDQNTDLPEGERADAADAEGWDPSVAVLAAGFPQVVDRMADDLDQTELLGDALLAQPQPFSSPEAAVDALVAALSAHDRDALLAAFGPENEDVIISGDPERDKDDRADFLAAYDAMQRVPVDQDGVATLYIGRE